MLKIITLYDINVMKLLSRLLTIRRPQYNGESTLNKESNTIGERNCQIETTFIGFVVFELMGRILTYCTDLYTTRAQ